MSRKLTPERALYFRDKFRNARTAANRDAEGFIAICQCIERFAFFLTGNNGGLGQAWGAINEAIARSPLAHDIPGRWPELHPDLRQLYESVREGRNQAVHEGAYARNLTRHAIELSLVIEDALQELGTVVRDFMVRDPVVAHLWEPVSFIRHKMLVNSFSFLPVWTEEDGWQFISDRTLAHYLRELDDQGRNRRRKRLAQPLEDALRDGVELEDAITVGSEKPVVEVVAKMGNSPVLVVSEARPSHLLGIVTAFDLM